MLGCSHKAKLYTIVTVSIISSVHNYTLVYHDISVKDPNLKVRLVVEDLISPTSMTFLAKDDILVLEKEGKVRRVLGNDIPEHPILDITSVVNTRERALLGIAISTEPKFSGDLKTQRSDSNVYLFFTEKILNKDINTHCLMKIV